MLEHRKGERCLFLWRADINNFERSDREYALSSAQWVFWLVLSLERVVVCSSKVEDVVREAWYWC